MNLILQRLKDQTSAFFNKGNERSLKARKNIFISLVVKSLGMVIMYLMVPISISYLGVENYGVWIVVSGIIAWSGMFDFGLSHGLRNHLAISIAKNEMEEGKSYVSTTYFLLLLVSILIAILGMISIHSFNLQQILNINSISEEQLQAIITIILFLFLFQFFLKPINSILQAYQLPSYTQIIGVAGSSIALVGICIALNFYETPSFNLYAIIVSGASGLVLLIGSLILFRTKFPKVRPALSQIKFHHFKKIGGLGVNFFIIQLCLLIVYASDNFLISYLFGPEEVTVYTIPFKYFSALTILFTVIMSPYWSAITDAYTKNEFDWIKKTVNQLIKILLGGLGVALIMFLISDFIFEIWIGNEIDVPRSLTALMGVYSLLMGIQTLFSFFSNGIGKIKMQMITYIFCAIINIPLSYYFGKILELGSSGVLLATIICLLIISTVLVIQYFKVINNKAQGIWLK